MVPIWNQLRRQITQKLSPVALTEWDIKNAFFLLPPTFIIPNVQPLHAHHLLCTSPLSKSRSDQSWLKPKRTDPIYALKMLSRGFHKWATSCCISKFCKVVIWYYPRKFGKWVELSLNHICWDNATFANTSIPSFWDRLANS